MPAPTRRAADAAPQPKPAPPVLELRDATFTYEGATRPSAEDVTLSVAAGECVVLCGESGCGVTAERCRPFGRDGESSRRYGCRVGRGCGTGGAECVGAAERYGTCGMGR